MCNKCEVLIFSERKMEGVRKVADDSIGHVVGGVYLMKAEILEAFKITNIISDKGRLLKAIA